MYLGLSEASKKNNQPEIPFGFVLGIDSCLAVGENAFQCQRSWPLRVRELEKRRTGSTRDTMFRSYGITMKYFLKFMPADRPSDT